MGDDEDLAARRRAGASRSPTALATAPPTPRSISSKIIVVAPPSLGQRDLEREDEARQFAAAGDPDQRRRTARRDWSRPRTRRGRARARPAARPAATTVRNRACVELERRQFAPPPPRRAAPPRRARAALSASAAAVIGGTRRAQARPPARRSARRPPRSRRAARVSSARSAGSASASTRCLRASARISNRRVSASSSRAGSKASASAARRARPRPPRPRSPPGRAPPAPRPAADARRRSGRAAAPPGAAGRAPPSEPCNSAATVPSSSPSRAPACIVARSAGERSLPRPARVRAGQLGDRMIEPFAVARGGLAPRRGRRRAPPRARASRCQAASAAAGVDPAVGVEQGAVAARVEQAAIVVLAVDLDQQRAELAQQRRPRPADR